MSTDAIILIGRDAGNASEVYETHAGRLASRTDADRVDVATYESEPTRELRDQLRAVDADDVYAVPMAAAHSHDTLQRLPGALDAVDGDVHYAEPVGRSPAVTEVVVDRAREATAGRDVTPGDSTLVLVGFGSSTKPYHRQTANYHAARVRERGVYGAVTTCYLLQNPTVECVRYDVSKPNAVAVPLFVARSEATARRIPEELELDRGGIQYADPLGTHERLTDAIAAEVQKQRTLASGRTDATGVDPLTGAHRPVATDGQGGTR